MNLGTVFKGVPTERQYFHAVLSQLLILYASIQKKWIIVGRKRIKLYAPIALVLIIVPVPGYLFLHHITYCEYGCSLP